MLYSNKANRTDPSLRWNLEDGNYVELRIGGSTGQTNLSFVKSGGSKQIWGNLFTYADNYEHFLPNITNRLNEFTTANELYINRYVENQSISFGSTQKSIFSWKPTDNKYGYAYLEISVTFSAVTDSNTYDEPDTVAISLKINNEVYSSNNVMVYGRDGGIINTYPMIWWGPSNTYSVCLNTNSRRNHTRNCTSYLIRGYLFTHYPFENM